MIAALIVLQVMQPQPMLRTDLAPATPNAVATARLSESQRRIAEARELLARAEEVRADYAPAAGQPTRAELDAAVDKAKSDLDSMSELGEEKSLRLQMTMDRMSKQMSTLSNLLKKISDTQNSIVQNIK